MSIQFDPFYAEKLLIPSYKEEGNWTWLLQLCNKILTLDPNNADARYDRAHAYVQLNRWSEAFPDATEALRLKPEHPDAAGARNVRAAYFQFKGKHIEAIEEYDAAIALRNHASDYFGRGKSLAALKRYDEAIEDLTKAIDGNFLIDQAKNVRGQCYFYQERWAEALADFSECPSSHKNYKGVVFNRGVCRRWLNQFAEAIVDATEVIGLDPQFSYAYNLRGSSLACLGQYEKALGDMDKAISLNPDVAEFYAERHNVHFRCQRIELALADLRKLSGMRTLRAQEHIVAAACCQELTDFDTALEHTKAASKLKLSQEDAAVVATLRADNLFQKGRQLKGGQGEELKTLGLIEFNHVIHLREELGNTAKLAAAYYRRGDALNISGKPASAEKDFTKAISLDPRALYYRCRGAARRNLKRLRQALEDFDKSLALEPEHAIALVYRGECFILLGQFGEALDDLNAALDLKEAFEQAIVYRAEALCGLGAHNSALADLDAVIAERETVARAFVLMNAYRVRAKCHAGLGNAEKATADESEYKRLEDELGNSPSWLPLN